MPSIAQENYTSCSPNKRIDGIMGNDIVTQKERQNQVA